jgi:hypothetical protein
MKIVVRKLDFNNVNDEVVEVIEDDSLSIAISTDYVINNKYKLCKGSATFYRKSRNDVIYFEYHQNSDAVPEKRSLYLDYMKEVG